MKPGKDLLSAIDQSETLKVRSSLAAWMRANREGFATRLSERVADWGELARLFTEAGLTDRFGRPPQPETARKIWQRVRKETKPPKVKADTPIPTPINPAEPEPGGDLLAAEMNKRSGKMPEPL